MTRLLWKKFDPNRILIHAGPELARFNPAIAEMKLQADQTSVYVCEGFTCQAPVSQEEDLARLLR
jgi:uncharacterized protein YyaL (SSP411 family)